jgi:AraC family transcriptional regulator
MEPIRRAIWYIEAHFASPIGLAEIAEASQLSRFHFSRCFAQSTGLSVSAYLRGRRLTEAARQLSKGAPNILSVALGVGYGSHEAFTRAFGDLFGVTPEEVRSRSSVENLPLLDPYIMNQSGTHLPQPEIYELGPFLLAGIREFRTYEERVAIPGQWQRFAPYLGNVPGQRGRDAYGVCLAPSCGEEGFDYLTAVAVRSLDELPEGLCGVRIARRRYATFRHDEHVSKIGATCAAIFGEWQPKAGVELANEPLFLIEHYGPGFDPVTGQGGHGGLGTVEGLDALL